MKFSANGRLRFLQMLLIAAGAFSSTASSAQTDTTEIYGKWGFGMELGPASGMYFLSGEAKQKISEGWGYSSLGITVSYARFHFMLQLGGMGGDIKQTLDYSPDWKQGNEFFTSNMQLSVGYEVLHTKWFRIIPFVTGGRTGFNTRPQHLRNPSFYSIGTEYAFGSAFDFKLNWQCLYFRIISGIYPTYFQQALHMNGSLVYANLSVGFYLTTRENEGARRRD